MAATTASRKGPNGPRTPASPRLDTALRPAAVDDHDLVDDTTLRRIDFADHALSGRAGTSVEFEECRFTRAALAGVRLERADFTDCAAATCDWSNLTATASSMTRVTITDSRLTGLTWTNGGLRDVRFQGCRIDLAALRFTTLRAVAFDDCNLAGVDFTHADLRGAAFTDCSLTGAQFAESTTAGARFIRCDLAGIGGVTNLRGAVLSGYDPGDLSRTLAAALGIVLT